MRFIRHLATCRVLEDTSDQSQELLDRRAIDIVFNRMEDACPALFQPPRPQTDHQNNLWLRVYPGTDLTAWVSKGEVKFVDPTRSIHEIGIGREEDWAKAPVSVECGRRHSVYFARIRHAK
jgi:hypothetical protein